MKVMEVLLGSMPEISGVFLLLMIFNILFIIFNILLLISRTMVCGTLVRQKGIAPSSFKAATK